MIIMLTVYDLRRDNRKDYENDLFSIHSAMTFWSVMVIGTLIQWNWLVHPLKTKTVFISGKVTKTRSFRSNFNDAFRKSYHGSNTMKLLMADIYSCITMVYERPYYEQCFLEKNITCTDQVQIKLPPKLSIVSFHSLDIVCW